MVLAARYTYVTGANYWHADDVYIGADLRGVLEILIAVLGCLKGHGVVESPCDWVILRLLDAGKCGLSSGRCSTEALTMRTPQGVCWKANSVPGDSFIRAEHAPRQPGTRLSNQQAVARLLGHHDCWVLENDCYGELDFEPGGQRLRDCWPRSV
jgi:hypothetical protein